MAHHGTLPTRHAGGVAAFGGSSCGGGLQRGLLRCWGFGEPMVGGGGCCSVQDCQSPAIWTLTPQTVM
eukprot:s3717_g2.t1